MGQAVLTLAALDVLLAAEATAGIQVKAIAQDRMKVMRRMGEPPFGWALCGQYDDLARTS